MRLYIRDLSLIRPVACLPWMTCGITHAQARMKIKPLILDAFDTRGVYPWLTCGNTRIKALMHVAGLSGPVPSRDQGKRVHRGG